MDIGTCLALRDDFEKFVESNNELHMYVSQNLQTDSIWLVGCGLTSHSAIFQLYSDGTVVQFPKFDLLPGNQRNGQLGVFSVPSLPQHGHRDVRRRLKPPCHSRTNLLYVCLQNYENISLNHFVNLSLGLNCT